MLIPQTAFCCRGSGGVSPTGRGVLRQFPGAAAINFCAQAAEIVMVASLPSTRNARSFHLRLKNTMVLHILSRCLQMPPDAPRCLQMPPGASRCLQIPPRCLPDAPQMPPDASQIPPRCLPNAPRCLQMPPDVSRCLQMPPDTSRCLQMPPDVSRCFQMPPRCLQIHRRLLTE